MLIRTEGLTRRYRLAGEDVAALRGVSLEIAAGEFVAVMGPSGSGKSTLMNLLGLLDTPTAGRYALDGEEVATLDPDRQAALRNRKIGFVFQAFNLLPRSTTLENVEVPLIYGGVAPSERRRRAERALGMMGLRHRFGPLPAQLSGGEQQRVAIARAIVTEPRVLLADEPTGALDSWTGLTVIALFQALHRAGRTILLITHDPAVARHADRILHLADGRVVADERVAAPLDACARLEREAEATP